MHFVKPKLFNQHFRKKKPRKHERRRILYYSNKKLIHFLKIILFIVNVSFQKKCQVTKIIYFSRWKQKFEIVEKRQHFWHADFKIFTTK